MTRGRCGSLLHIRMTFAFTTPRRFNRRTRRIPDGELLAQSGHLAQTAGRKLRDADVPADEMNEENFAAAFGEKFSSFISSAGTSASRNFLPAEMNEENFAAAFGEKFS